MINSIGLSLSRSLGSDRQSKDCLPLELASPSFVSCNTFLRLCIIRHEYLWRFAFLWPGSLILKLFLLQTHQLIPDILLHRCQYLLSLTTILLLRRSGGCGLEWFFCLLLLLSLFRLFLKLLFGISLLCILVLLHKRVVWKVRGVLFGFDISCFHHFVEFEHFLYLLIFVY